MIRHFFNALDLYKANLGVRAQDRILLVPSGPNDSEDFRIQIGLIDWVIVIQDWANGKAVTQPTRGSFVQGNGQMEATCHQGSTM